MIHLKDGQNRWTVVVDGTSNVFDESHPLYAELVDAVFKSDEEAFRSLLVNDSVLNDWSEGKFRLKGGYLLYEDLQLDDLVSGHVVSMIKNKVDYKPVLLFVENLYKNSSFGVVERLYKFLSHKNLPITSDGCFLGYKAVTKDFKDKHTQTIDNKVGQKPSVARNMVNDDMNKECSNGLHVGTLQYVTSFASHGDNMIICKVNPANVVAVPYADAQKLRCCEYEVVDLYTKPLDDHYNDDYEEDDEEDEDDEESCGYCGSCYCESECLDDDDDEDEDDDEDDDEYDQSRW